MFKSMRFRAWARQQSDKSIKAMLADNDLFDKVYGEVDAAHEGHGGILTDLIDWIKSDPQGFLAFVKSLIALFSV